MRRLKIVHTNPIYKCIAELYLSSFLKKEKKEEEGAIGWAKNYDYMHITEQSRVNARGSHDKHITCHV